jgi:hypothetical protein
MPKSTRVKSHHKSKGGTTKRVAIKQEKRSGNSTMAESTRVRSYHKSKSGSAKRVACPKKKLKWTPMAIYRTPLNREQAVLSCCNATTRVVIGFMGSWGCWYLWCAPQPPAGDTGAASS